MYNIVDKQKEKARNNLSRGMVNAGFIDARVHDDLRAWLYEFPGGGKYDTNKNNGTKVSRSRGNTRDKYFARETVHGRETRSVFPFSFLRVTINKKDTLNSIIIAASKYFYFNFNIVVDWKKK